MFKSILVATDGSQTATVAIREAIDLASAVGARLHLVNAYVERRPQSGIHRDPRVDKPAGTAEAELARGALDQASQMAVAAGLEASAHARNGDAASVILDLAEELQADLIVVGNRGMTGAARFLLGSVPNKISHGAACSVLIVRTS
jgi:nucleotide-binding universal stress UspA family protein